jgi:hypothetical protein
VVSDAHVIDVGRLDLAERVAELMGGAGELHGGPAVAELWLRHGVLLVIGVKIGWPSYASGPSDVTADVVRSYDAAFVDGVANVTT